MKSHVKALALALAVGAIGQAVYAYANQPPTEGGTLVFSQCDELREKLAELIERERERSRFEVQFESPGVRDKRVHEILGELEAMMSRPQMRAEPGP